MGRVEGLVTWVKAIPLNKDLPRHLSNIFSYDIIQYASNISNITQNLFYKIF